MSNLWQMKVVGQFQPSHLTIEQRVSGAAEQNARLLQTLAEADYAVSAFQHNTHYIEGLKNQIAEDEQEIGNLPLATSKEYEDHENYWNSYVKHFASKLIGREVEFGEQAMKEEIKWLDAVQSELKANNGLDQLKLDLTAAETANAELTSVVSVHNSAQAELTELYSQLFDGPTPGIPGEDEKETALKKAEHDFNVRQFQFSNEKQAAEFL